MPAALPVGLRVLTWNGRHLGHSDKDVSDLKLGFLQGILRSRKPHIVFLQEIGLRPHLLADWAARQGFRFTYSAPARGQGIAVLTEWKFWDKYGLHVEEVLQGAALGL